jgi:hypothetical protein
MLAHRLAAIVLGALALALVASSCIVPVRVPGTVTFAWTVGGTANRKACTDRNATFVHVIVRDDAGDLVEDDAAPCDSFRSRYVLDRGWYSASLTLLDGQRRRVSETQDTGELYVTPRLDTFVEVAFESSVGPR